MYRGNVVSCPRATGQSEQSVIKTKSTFCSLAVFLWSYVKRSYFIPTHTKTLIGLAFALIHTPFLSTLLSAIFTLFFSFSVLPFCEHLFDIYACQAEFLNWNISSKKILNEVKTIAIENGSDFRNITKSNARNWFKMSDKSLFWKIFNFTNCLSSEHFIKILSIYITLFSSKEGKLSRLKLQYPKQ